MTNEEMYKVLNDVLQCWDYIGVSRMLKYGHIEDPNKHGLVLRLYTSFAECRIYKKGEIISVNFVEKAEVVHYFHWHSVVKDVVHFIAQLTSKEMIKEFLAKQG